MSGADEKGSKGSVYDDHLRLWLRAGLTGCHFASSVATQARINYLDQLNELVPADVAMINKHIDTAGAEEFFAVVLFPRVRTPREIVRLLKTLCTDDRWSAKRVPWKTHARSGVSPIGIEYSAATGERSSVMGLAPLGCMPITRRAPYVALATYGGPKATAYKRTNEGELGLIDARAGCHGSGAHRGRSSEALEPNDGTREGSEPGPTGSSLPTGGSLLDAARRVLSGGRPRRRLAPGRLGTSPC